MTGIETPLTRLLGCTVPVQQAGFGGALNTRLAAAVAQAGGIGMLGGALAAADDLGYAIAEVRAGGHGAVGVNFVVPFLDIAEHRAALDVAAAGADLVEFFYAEPDPALVELVRAGGARVGWQVGSAREARSAAAAGVDVVVLQGIEAGGHVRATAGLLPMLAAVLDAVDVPVIAAGGIATPRAMAAVLAAGAAGVRMGTRFVASHESDFHHLRHHFKPLADCGSILGQTAGVAILNGTLGAFCRDLEESPVGISLGIAMFVNSRGILAKEVPLIR